MRKDLVDLNNSNCGVKRNKIRLCGCNLIWAIRHTMIFINIMKMGKGRVIHTYVDELVNIRLDDN